MKAELFVCNRCGSTENITVTYVNDVPKTFCEKCRVEMFSKKNHVGRPSLGVTKKVSLTLPEEEWTWFDHQARGNRSQFLRHLVWEAQSSESEWSNNACLGYAIAAAEKIGMNNEQINKLVRAIYGQFDSKTLAEAKDVYIKSDY